MSLTRKKFIESYGATANNWRTDWSFVNHEEKLIIFGAWDTHTEGDRSLILHKSWKVNKKSRKQPGYTQSIEHIRLIEEQGYKLKTFPIIEDLDFVDETDSGRASIKAFIKTLTDMALSFAEDGWYAVGEHKPEHSIKPSTAEAKELLDIFNLDVNQTEKESLVMSRIGQGKFRKNVIDVWGNGEKCALTGISIREMLIASHILPWAKCTDNAQRLDGSNGILLCSHVDKLFDRHLITFEKKSLRYVIKISNKLDYRELGGIGISSGLELAIGRMHPRFQLRFDEYILEHNKTFEINNSK